MAKLHLRYDIIANMYFCYFMLYLLFVYPIFSLNGGGVIIVVTGLFSCSIVAIRYYCFRNLCCIQKPVTDSEVKC